MIILVIIVLLKLFTIMKIFSSLTPITVMLQRVIFDLSIFLFFFFLLVFFFSMITSVMGLGNRRVEGLFRDKYKDYDIDNPYDKCGNTMPGIEYEQVGLFMGNFFGILRAGVGDFSIIGLTGFLNVTESIIFWIVWTMAVIICAVIFLNLVVAEASQSYTVVSETLEQVIQKEKSALISDSEIMTFSKSKSAQKFPKYIVIR